MKVPAFFLFSFSAASLIGANDRCAPESPATCYPEACDCMYCLGPTNDGVNAPVNPLTCNGDLEITLAGFYWKPHQDGMEYAIESHVENTDAERYRLIDADFKNPNFKWDFGFKLGLGYNTTCDGWDFGVLWTWFQGRADSHNEAEGEDNITLLALWSAQTEETDPGLPLFATDIETRWKLKLNLIDIALGRKFWNSPRVALRPHIGLRIGYIDQDFRIEYKGGTWSDLNGNQVNDQVHLENDFKGAGLRAGLDTNWHFGCGWSLYGDFALSQIYGRFDVDHDEATRDTTPPFEKVNVLESKNSFRTTTLIVDVGLGVEYAALFCDCNYGLAVSLGWEQHLFLHQNQMWRVVPQEGSSTNDINNIYHQRRGDLSTQGWTLKVVFDFQGESLRS